MGGKSASNPNLSTEEAEAARVAMQQKAMIKKVESQKQMESIQDKKNKTASEQALAKKELSKKYTFQSPNQKKTGKKEEHQKSAENNKQDAKLGIATQNEQD